MKKHIFALAASLLSSTTLLWADIDVTELYLNNAGFDNSAHYDYTKNDNGNVSQEILPIFGWEKDIEVDYTVTGIYELGTAKTFNTNGKVPASGYNGSKGGCLALSTGWDQPLKFYQEVQLPAGNYKLESAFYNGSNSTAGGSLLGWIPKNGTGKLSALNNFPLNSWTLDEVSFSLSAETEGRIQIGFLGASGGSANSAKIVSDFVKITMVGDNSTLISNQRSVLQKTVDNAQNRYGNGNGNEAAALKTVIDEAKTAITNSSSSYIELYRLNEKLNQQIVKYNWANATASNPIDMTSRIVNPSFEDGLKGWSVTNLGSQTNTSFTQKSGNTYIEKWVSNGNRVGNFSALQTLSTDLPMGIYQLKVGAQNTQNGKNGQTGAWVVGGNDSIAISEAKVYTLQFIHMEEQLTIGIIGENASGNWIALDNFTLSYSAATADDYKNELNRRTATAKQLLSQRINSNARAQLQTAVNNADEWMKSADLATLATTSSALKAAANTALQSANCFGKLAAAIANAESLMQQLPKGQAELKTAIYKAKADLEDETLANEDLEASVAALQAAQLMFRVANATGQAPSVTSNPCVLRGATMAFGRATFSGSNIMEKGFCWSTHYNPTITDHRSTLSYSNNGDIYIIDGLQPSMFYYVRPYAISSNYAVGYGECVKICTLPMGNVTWTYNNGGSDDEDARINAAVADAVDIWNNITSIKGLRVSVSYGASTPTADCSYGGSMRVGPNSSYQRTGTILHEMAHAIGVGTIERWYNSATYRQNTSSGFWLGERTDRVLAFLENDESAHLKGDKTHFWPYGVNGANEDNGTRMLYYANALIVQALGEDFLPPVYGTFASPAYTFTQEDDNTYYIIPEGSNFGSQTTMLKADDNGNLGVEQQRLESALTNPACTWKIRFNPTTQLYEFKNTLSDKNLANNNTQATVSGSENFGIQLLGSRQNTTFGKFNLKSYWLVFNNGTNQPRTLSRNNNATSAASFDHQNSAVSQRWIILSRHELMDLAGIDYTNHEAVASTPTALNVWGGENNLTIETGDKGCWVTIRNILGQQVAQFYMQAGMRITQQMPAGIYLVNGNKAVVNGRR